MRKILFFISMSLFPSLFAEEGEPIEPMPDLGPLMEPDPVSFSFVTPGWYILALILLIFLLVYIIKWIKQYRKNAYRREALKRLSNLKDQPHKDSEELILNEILILLKRVALQAYGRKTVAMLSGTAWFEYLESKGKNTPFTTYAISVSEAIYESKPIDNTQLNKLIEISKKWIKTHA